MYRGEQLKRITLFPADVMLKTARIPFELGRFGMSIVGIPSNPRLARRLQAEAPLLKAELGIEAIEHGHELEPVDASAAEELVQVGGAMVIVACVDAAHHSEVPDNVTHQVVEIASSHHIDPFENPLISNDLAQEAQRQIPR